MNQSQLQYHQQGKRPHHLQFNDMIALNTRKKVKHNQLLDRLQCSRDHSSQIDVNHKSNKTKKEKHKKSNHKHKHKSKHKHKHKHNSDLKSSLHSRQQQISPKSHTPNLPIDQKIDCAYQRISQQKRQQNPQNNKPHSPQRQEGKSQKVRSKRVKKVNGKTKIGKRETKEELEKEELEDKMSQGSQLAAQKQRADDEALEEQIRQQELGRIERSQNRRVQKTSRKNKGSVSKQKKPRKPKQKKISDIPQHLLQTQKTVEEMLKKRKTTKIKLQSEAKRRIKARKKPKEIQILDDDEEEARNPIGQDENGNMYLDIDKLLANNDNNSLEKKKKKTGRKPKKENGEKKEDNVENRNGKRKNHEDSTQFPGLKKSSMRNLVTTKSSEHIAVDEYSTKVDQGRVYSVDTNYYCTTLTQSNIVKDDNKFYKLQVLQMHENSQMFYLFARWGRVGIVGQIKEEGPMSKREVLRKYHEISQNKIKKGNYKILENRYNNENIEIGGHVPAERMQRRSALPLKVQEIVKLIFDIKMMNNHMKEIGYDERKMPLGMLGKKNILKGYEALRGLLEQIRSTKREYEKKQICNRLSSQFYSAIPHDFGYLNMQAFVIDSEQKVTKKLEMLESLQDIQVYTRLLNDRSLPSQMHEIDCKYLKLNSIINPIQNDMPIFTTIIKYVKNTHAKTHDNYLLEVQEVLEVTRKGEEQRFNNKLHNKYLLWHGSRLTNYVGILSEGLKIAPNQSPKTGYMFGKGIYFADMVSKSANYCLASRINNVGILLLCEVALGEMNLKFEPDYQANKLPSDRHSTKGVGKTAPIGGELLGDVWVPNGDPGTVEIGETSLLYNQFVVYDVSQIKCRYLVKVRFHFK